MKPLVPEGELAGKYPISPSEFRLTFERDGARAMTFGSDDPIVLECKGTGGRSG